MLENETTNSASRGDNANCAEEETAKESESIGVYQWLGGPS